jgi:hypothetical protein
LSGVEAIAAIDKLTASPCPSLIWRSHCLA